MSDNLGMATQLAGQGLRFGWYFALNRLVDWRTSRLGLARPPYKPGRPVPSLQQLLAAQAQLLEQLVNKTHDRLDFGRLGQLAPLSLQAVLSSYSPTMTRSELEEVAAGRAVFHEIYTEAEMKRDPAKRNTALFYFRGRPGASIRVHFAPPSCDT